MQVATVHIPCNTTFKSPKHHDCTRLQRSSASRQEIVLKWTQELCEALVKDFQRQSIERQH